MKVYVKSQSGKWLMPTNPANAGILLKHGKAEVIKPDLLYHKNFKQACLVRDKFRCRVCEAESKAE